MDPASRIMNDDKLTYDLISAIINNDPQCVKNLLDQGAQPNRSLDEANVTPLHYAAQHNALNCIPLLIECGANVHTITEPDGQTPLDIALLHQHRNIVQLLMYYAENREPAIN